MPVAFPPGEYSPEIMGKDFPLTDPADIEALASSRFAVAQDNRVLADNNRLAQVILTDQSGATADDMDGQLSIALRRHDDTATRNDLVGQSYTAIAQVFRRVQAELNEIATVADIVIRAAQNSSLSAADKITAIASLIEEFKGFVKISVASGVGEINGYVTSLMQIDGVDPRSPSLLPDSVAGNDRGLQSHFFESTDENVQEETQPALFSQPAPPIGDVSSAGYTPPPNLGEQGSSTPVTAVPATTIGSPVLTSGPSTPSLGNSIPPTTASPVGTPVNVSNTTSLVRPDASTLATPLTPQAQLNQFSNQFSEGLVQGMQNQVTMPVSPVAAAAPMQLDTHEPAATSQVSASAPAYAAAAPAPIAPVEQHAPMVAAPAPAPAIAAAPAAPVGQLPAYGADIRPATPILASAAAPPVPSTPAVASSVASAPTSASSSTALGQPAVVRHAPIAAPPNGMPIAGEAAFAAATSAVAGEVNHQAIEQARLHRLVDSIARQEPGFRWAIGEREDGSTLLVTDVACGWIPPGVEVPVGVEVLEPERRRGDLIALLGDASLTAAYSPGQYISQPDTSEPINMSTRSLHANPIKDLGWELGQATNWRDGLPQLAHTLAKAAAAGTGILDAEVDMLQQHLAAVRDEVMSTYPDHNPSAAENFMLLAAIIALIAGDNRAANYHFAWFQAVGTTTPPL